MLDVVGTTSHTVSEGFVKPEYSFTLKWEREFDYEAARRWMLQNQHIPWNMSILFYLSAIYLGQKWMENREPLKIKGVMTIWNCALALFSVVALVRVFPEFYHGLSKYGFVHSICSNSYTKVNEANFWIFLFTLSKIPELVDTIWLVLRKQKLMFLHVYHHSTVLTLSWYMYAQGLAVSRWCTNMNLFVHALMYSYYALKAVPHIIRIPKWVSMMITTLQSIQMVIGTYVVGKAYHLYLKGESCSASTSVSTAAMFIYISYFVLFSNFFYRTYLTSGKRADRTKTTPLAEKKKI